MNIKKCRTIPVMHSLPPRKPEWLRKKLDLHSLERISSVIRRRKLSTVCVEAACPNISECFGAGAATFLILGDKCTRGCRFCNVGKGEPEKADLHEPERIGLAVREMNLSYSVITSVTRDDLPDGGAGHFSRTVHEIKKHSPDTAVELLVPDFGGKQENLEKVISSGASVVAHNIETVSRLYHLRPGYDYKRSLKIIKELKKPERIISKSGFMVGMGEKKEEVKRLIFDLAETGCEFLSIGQYLAPSEKHHPVSEYVHPDRFEAYKEMAKEAGIRRVKSGPYVRSSYMAESYSKERGE